MKIQNINPGTLFRAKIVRNSLFQSAVNEAKKAPEYEKRGFYNALDLIHNDFTLKSVELKKALDCVLCPPRHIVTVTYDNDYINTYTNTVNDNAKEGIEAMHSLFHFIENHYGTRMLQIIKGKRLSADTDINMKIDSVLQANSYRYML